MAGHNVSHSQRHTKRRFMPNLQSVRTTQEGRSVRLRVCTRCIKAGKVPRAA